MKSCGSEVAREIVDVIAALIISERDDVGIRPPDMLDIADRVPEHRFVDKSMRPHRFEPFCFSVP